MGLPHDIDEAKRTLRKAAAASRDSAAARDDGQAGRRLAEFLLRPGLIAKGAVVSGFWPIGSEIDVMAGLRALAARGHPVALPVVMGMKRPLLFRLWRDGDGMSEGRYGIREPLERAAAVDPDVLLVPLLAFDRAGFRLGYGGGFYDRSLAGLRERARPVAIGVAWAAQEVATVPHDRLDQPLDWIITDREAIKIEEARV